MADDNGETKGFVQMYPSFCSVDVIRICILYDLQVDASGRNLGIDSMLMNKASEYAKEQGTTRIDLITAFSNKTAQHLYEKPGFKKV